MATHKNRRRWGAELFELFGSMRFAITLLVVICIASAIGSLIEQNREEIFYLDSFGTYWYLVFSKFGVSHIYNTTWFLVVMAFLVFSTTLCLIRNVPKIVNDMRSFKAYVRQSSWRAFHHKIDIATAYSHAQSLAMAKLWLHKNGYAYQEKQEGDTILLAAKKGSSNRLGYIFAHLAIIVICMGGLLDSELPNRIGIWLGNKTPIPTAASFLSEVPPTSIFSSGNMSFRGNIDVSEGGTTDHAMLTLGDDNYVQSLPFSVTLNKFIIEYYQTNGMPKRFASDVTITDYVTGKKEQKIIEVNHPYEMHGISLYQSSFHDGGSKVTLLGHAVQGENTNSFEVNTNVGGVSEFTTEVNGVRQQWRLRVDDFRLMNIEDLNRADAMHTPKDFQTQLLAVTGSASNEQSENLVNVGPSVRYTLTDASNQSIHYQNYMLPIMLDQHLVYLAGVKFPMDRGFSYVRIPVDEKGGMGEFLALRAALNNAALRHQAAKAYVDKVGQQPLSQADILTLAERALDIFATSGFKGLEDYVDGVGVPEKEHIPEKIRQSVKHILRDYLMFSMVELRNSVRQQMGMSILHYTDSVEAEKQAKWFDAAMVALSDIVHYPSPVMLSLQNFKHIQATVLQATRSPGKHGVYLGCLLLVLGVFQMFYVKERRIWLWVVPNGNASHIRAAMTSQKRNLDFEREFTKFEHDFMALKGG